MTASCSSQAEQVFIECVLAQQVRKRPAQTRARALVVGHAVGADHGQGWAKMRRTSASFIAK
jgi:hypothetical protein